MQNSSTWHYPDAANYQFRLNPVAAANQPCGRAALILPLLLLLILPALVQAQFTFTINNSQVTITGYTGPGGAVVIPSIINGYPVTIIGNGAFSPFQGNTSPTSLTISHTVTNIGTYVFDECVGLTNIIIGFGVQSIGIGTFVNCYSLTAITMNEANSFYSSTNGILFNKSQTTLVQYPEGKQAADYTVPNSVINIGDTAFENSALSSITIPNSVTRIGNAAFRFCSGLTRVIIGTNVTSIGDNSFEGCSSLQNIAIPSGITSIGFATFEACGFTNVTIPNGVISIGTAAFDICGSLTNVTIPSSVTSIANLAFYNCPLTAIVIPDGVTTIGYSAFSHCFSLTSVYFTGNAPTPTNDSSVFQYDNNATAYYLPGTTGWGSSFCGLPAVLWNPQIQTGDGSFGAQMNGFGFAISGTINIPILVEACTNLASASWTPLQSCTLTNGSIYFSDPQWTNYPTRLYRIRSP